MSNKISVVINTLNEEKNIKRAIKSVSWADEVVVCDMHSQDETVVLATKMGAKIVTHVPQDHVELVRNFNISQAKNDWVLILDPDEEVNQSLAEELQRIADRNEVVYVEIPRQNLIFGKWMKAAMWWPDYNIRFFKKGSVVWKEEIHRPPDVLGQGLKLEAKDDFALIHHHYESLDQFLGRMNRYTSVQAGELVKQGYHLQWPDLVNKPLGEFLSRFFAHQGFTDGLHGLALSLLQAFSFLVMYLKVWELEKFKDQEVKLTELKQVSKNGGKEIDYWFKYGNLSANPVKRFLQKVNNKLS